MSRRTDAYAALPDPQTQPAFYEGVALKRLLAWIVDSLLVGVISAVIASLPLFLLWFVFPLVFAIVSVIYRIGTIASYSATPGMALFNLQLRTHTGARLSGSDAALHTLSFLVASAFFLPQMVSAVLMLTTPRHQGLHDMLCGVVAINAPARS